MLSLSDSYQAGVIETNFTSSYLDGLLNVDDA